jgi:hypothetical protein
MLIPALICQTITSLLALITIVADEDSSTTFNMFMAVLFGLPLGYMISQLFN